MAAVFQHCSLRGACIGLFVVASTAAMADDAPPAQIKLLAPIRYAPQANATSAVRAECELEKSLQTDLLAALRTHGREVETVTSTDSGRVLEVLIQRVESPGSQWTGPKMLSLTVRSYKDGKSDHLKMLSAWGRGGVNIFANVCYVLHQNSRSLAEQVAGWLDELDQSASEKADAARVPSNAASMTIR